MSPTFLAGTVKTFSLQESGGCLQINRIELLNVLTAFLFRIFVAKGTINKCPFTTF